MAASWDPQKNITNALLHCTSRAHYESIARLKRCLTQSAPLFIHPMLLPTIIMDLETTLTLQDDEYWTTAITDIENETKQTPHNAESVDPLELDLPSIVQRLNGCSVFLSLIERESEAVLVHLDQSRRAITELQSQYPRLTESSRTLIRHVDFLINSRKSLFLRLQNLQRRSQTQLAFVCSLFGRVLVRCDTNYSSV
jgi:hypothetical protein